MAGEDERSRVVPDEERARALLEQLRGVHAADIGRDMVLAAINYSSPKLGLSDETRAVRNLSDVRVSIELVRAILEVLDREGAGPTADLHDTLAQLQLAFAHAVQLANAERAAEAAGPKAPEAETAEAPPAAAAEPAEPAGEEPPAEAAGTPAPEEAAPKRPARKAAPKRPATGKDVPKTPPAKKKPAAKKKRPAGS